MDPYLAKQNDSCTMERIINNNLDLRALLKPGDIFVCILYIWFRHIKKLLENEGFGEPMAAFKEKRAYLDTEKSKFSVVEAVHGIIKKGNTNFSVSR